MNILVGQNHLNSIGGSETFTYTLIESLLRKYKVELILGSNQKGLMSSKIEEDLDIKTNVFQKKKYEYAFLNHNSTVKKVFDLGLDKKINKICQICHGIYPQLEQPYIDKTGKLQYIAISEEVQLHLKNKYNLKSTVIFNGVNMKRFKPLNDVNDKPVKFLSLSQSAVFNSTLKAILNKNGYSNLETFNKFKNPVFDIEKKIQQADIVFTLGRGVYESMACARNVIIADHRPYSVSQMDGYVSHYSFLEFMRNNCSGRRMKMEVNEKNIMDAINQYSVYNGIQNQTLARMYLNIDKQVDEKYLKL